MTVAVFYMRETFEVPGLADQTVYLFPDEDAAWGFIYDGMEKAGMVERATTQPGWICKLDDTVHRTLEDAVEAARDCYGLLEFFHIFPVEDRR